MAFSIFSAWAASAAHTKLAPAAQATPDIAAPAALGIAVPSALEATA